MSGEFIYSRGLNITFFFCRTDFHQKLLLVAVILVSTTESVHFNCFYKYDVPNTMWDSYQCDATITLTGSNALESVTGNHDVNKTNDNIEYLSIKDQPMPFFPERLLDFFKILKAISLFNTQLVTLSASDLQQIPGLLHLAVQRNNLDSLDADLFQFTPLVRLLAADGNQIQHIGHNFIAHTNDLSYLYLQNNVCINVNAQGRTEVLEIAPTISVLCPPLAVTTTESTTASTTLPTTTTRSTNPTTTVQTPSQRDVYEEIDELRASNIALEIRVDDLKDFNGKQVEDIDKLQKSVSAFEKRILEIEKKLAEN